MWRKLVVATVVLVLLVGVVGLFVWRHARLPVMLSLPPQGAVLDGVTVVNPGNPPQPGQRVVVEGGRITAIQPSAAPTGPYVGRYVLPGLTDMHVHLPLDMHLGQAQLFGFLLLAHGVTTVRDAGSLDGASLVYRVQVKNGEWAGPRIFACGPIVDGDPPLWPGSKVVRTPEEGRAVVDELADLGGDCIKVYNQLTAEALAAIRDAAHAKGLPVIGHVPIRVPYQQALLDDAQHLIGAAGQPPDGAKSMGEGLSTWLSIDKQQYATIAKVVIAHDLANTPTLVTLDRVALVEDYEAARNDPAAAMLPRTFRDVMWNPLIGLPFLRRMTAEDYAVIRETRRARFHMVRILHSVGARLHLGTDVQIPFVVPGISLHQEMRLFVEAGVPLEQVWVYATRGAAKALRVPDHGELREGAAADLLVFRDDPTKDLAALQTLEAVVAQGRLYTKEMLDTAMQRYRERYADPWFDDLSMRLTQLAMQRMFDE